MERRKRKAQRLQTPSEIRTRDRSYGIQRSWGIQSVDSSMREVATYLLSDPVDPIEGQGPGAVSLSPLATKAASETEEIAHGPFDLASPLPALDGSQPNFDLKWEQLVEYDDPLDDEIEPEAQELEADDPARDIDPEESGDRNEGFADDDPDDFEPDFHHVGNGYDE
ncbi:MAG: hypothetical protein HC794_02010 [Nitrospiraceae bacterium]|nr:hypothetical protein [Nitrospiraceae bacterium]